MKGLRIIRSIALYFFLLILTIVFCFGVNCVLIPYAFSAYDWIVTGIIINNPAAINNGYGRAATCYHGCEYRDKNYAYYRYDIGVRNTTAHPVRFRIRGWSFREVLYKILASPTLIAVDGMDEERQFYIEAGEELQLEIIFRAERVQSCGETVKVDKSICPFYIIVDE